MAAIGSRPWSAACWAAPHFIRRRDCRRTLTVLITIIISRDDPFLAQDHGRLPVSPLCKSLILRRQPYINNELGKMVGDNVRKTALDSLKKTVLIRSGFEALYFSAAHHL